MIDCGHNSTTGWRPSEFLLHQISRVYLNYLLVTNVDQDHLSDLSGLVGSGITIGNLISNTAVSPQSLRAIKERAGPLTDDAEIYMRMRTAGGAAGSGIPFHRGMGGITLNAFAHSYPYFTDTNNLSCAFFIGYGPFKILFPGDLEQDGWRAHLRNPMFVQELRTTTVLVAAHHGRANGYCDEAFQYFVPQVVVMSDRSIIHDTQETGRQYRAKVGTGVKLTNSPNRRFLLTTRSDGDIVFEVDIGGNYRVTTGLDST